MYFAIHRLVGDVLECRGVLAKPGIVKVPRDSKAGAGYDELPDPDDDEPMLAVMVDRPRSMPLRTERTLSYVSNVLSQTSQRRPTAYSWQNDVAWSPEHSLENVGAERA